MFAIFFINIFNESIYVLIFNSFSDEYLILKATEDFKNSILGALFGAMGVYVDQKTCNAVLLSSISSCPQFLT